MEQGNAGGIAVLGIGGNCARPVLGAALCVLAGVCAAQGRDTLVLGPGNEQIPLAGHIAVLHDEGGQLSYDDIRAPHVAARFIPSEHGYFSRGMSRGDTYWYRLALHNPFDATTVDWVLDLGIATLDFVDLYVQRADGTFEGILAGDLRPGSPRLLPAPTFALPFRAAAGEDLEIYMRVQTTGRHQVLPSLWTAEGYAHDYAGLRLFWGVVYGVYLIMALYNLLVFAAIRDRAYLYYVLFIVGMAGSSLTYSGDARLYGNDLFDGAPAWVNATAALWPGLIALFAMLFGREFMQTRLHAPRLDRLLIGASVLAALVVLLQPVLGFFDTLRLNLGIFLVYMPALLGTSIYLSLKGVRAARFYLLAWGLVLASFLVYLGSVLGVLPPTFTLLTSPVLSTCLSVALLSLALADRINTARREQFAAAEQANRLKSFLPGRVAELVQGGDHALLQPKRREVTVCAIDLRGFTPFAETSAPEDVMAVLREFYAAMGAVVEKHGGTVEHFAGDSMVIFFNAPLELPEAERHAVEAALEMRAAFAGLREKWSRLGHELGLGIGIADGYATIGAIGFAGRSQYAAIGAVTNLASRLCSSAAHGEILTTARVLAAVDSLVESESAGTQSIKGFHRPVDVIRIAGLRKPETLMPAQRLEQAS